MTVEKEVDIVHKLLAYMLEKPGRINYLPDMLSTYGIDPQLRSLILNKLETDNLVKIPNRDGANRLIMVLTPHGLNIARHPGGYLGYLEEQRQQILLQEKAQAKKEQLDRQTTLDGVKANWWAVRVSIAGIVVGAFFSIISLVQSANTAADLEIAKKEIILLKQQINSLNTHK
jgi:hypothetical protein